MRIVWKVVSMISVVTYYLHHHNTEFSIVLFITTSLTIITVIAIIISSHHSYRSVLFATILFVMFSVFDLCYLWSSDDLNLFIVTLSCQLAVLGALMYTIGYIYPRKDTIRN